MGEGSNQEVLDALMRVLNEIRSDDFRLAFQNMDARLRLPGFVSAIATIEAQAYLLRNEGLNNGE